MSVSILIISHQEVGNALINAAKTTLGTELPLCISTIEVQPQADIDQLIPEVKRLAKEIDQGDGILILTDLYGSTPSNIAVQIKTVTRVKIVTGLNLPMVLRALNYPNLDLIQMAAKAKSGGQEGIIAADENEEEN